MTSLNSFAKETLSMAKSFILDQNIESFIFPIKPSSRKDAPAVLLIPGYLERPGCFRALNEKLTLEGFRVFVYRPQEFFVSIEKHAQNVLQFIRLIHREQKVRSLCLVGHSMGGLIARKAASYSWKSPSPVRAVVTVGTPNHGTFLSYLGIGQCAAEMVPGSSFLKTLDSADVRQRHKIVCFAASDDLLVPDTGSARLEGATYHEVPEVGHLAILDDSLFLNLLTTELKNRLLVKTSPLAKAA